MVTVFSLDNTPPVAANNSRLGHIDSIPLPVLDLRRLFAFEACNSLMTLTPSQIEAILRIVREGA